MPAAVTDTESGAGAAREATSGPEPDESPKERVDRELIELLNGLRVILPGVQVLLAFLLTVPFSTGFARASSTDHVVYFVTVLMTVAATGALTMPAAYHRLRFREGDKERMLRISNQAAIAGLGLLSGAMASGVFLVTNVLFGLATAVLVAVIVLVVLGACWFAVPLWRKSEDRP
jgi:hypothetical protein